MFVKERFILNENTKKILQNLIPEFGYGSFGEFIYYRTYSRFINNKQEKWADTVIRVTEGTLSIRKDWYKRANVEWNEGFWQTFATGFALAMFNMQWLPPGRGLWAMGSDFVYERGAMALYNCAATELGENYPRDLEWMMDSLMHGVGVGFKPVRDDNLVLKTPKGSYPFIIDDTRESWCDATRMLLDSYLHGGPRPHFQYHLIRPKGLPIKGFGGVASGPEPLIELHNKIVQFSERYILAQQNNGDFYDSVMYKSDIANLIGCCVVAGNVRRSAEIAIGEFDDPVFPDLKNYNNDRFSYRAEHGWMSNNSVILYKDEDFENLGDISERVKLNGEPGYLNLRNFIFGRLKDNDYFIPDKATLLNPCGEIPLENKEVCNLSETLPTRCKDIDDWYDACNYATFYSSTVSLLPTHQPETNKVIARNRRIGVGIVDFTGWIQNAGLHKVTKYLREGYEIVRHVNAYFNAEAGVPPAIRVTTIKPGGTVPKMAGRQSGAGYPTFTHTLRRVRVQEDSQISRLLKAASVPYEKDLYSQNTEVFEFPIIQGPAKPAEKISLWQQAMNLVLLQREWSDNAVSNTLFFKPKWQLTEVVENNHQQRLLLHVADPKKIIEGEQEFYINDEQKIQILRNQDPVVIKIFHFNPDHEEDDIEAVLSAIAPLTKSVSLLPHTADGVYPQTPESGISEAEYNRRVSEISTIDWSQLKGSDGEDELYCVGDKCDIKR